MTHALLALLAAPPGPTPGRPTEGPQISALFLLIPAALLVLVGIWGWRNAESLALSLPLDERTQQKRRRVYQRGAVFCIVVAIAFVVLVVLSFLSVGSPR